MIKSDNRMSHGGPGSMVLKSVVVVGAVVVAVLLLMPILLSGRHSNRTAAFSETGEFLLSSEELSNHFDNSKWKLPVREINAVEDFLDYITKPAATCESVVIIGGRKCHEYDDHVVCLERSLRLDHDSCLVYSFGAGSGSFETGMTKLGCNVYTFDPHMSSRTDRRSGERTWRLALHLAGNDSATLPGDRVMTLDEVSRSLGHRARRIDYMRLDLDGGEWWALRRALAEPESLARVQQLGVQLALDVLELTPPERLHRLRTLHQVLVAVEHSGLRLVSSRPQAEQHACQQLPELLTTAAKSDSQPLCDYYDLLFVRKE